MSKCTKLHSKTLAEAMCRLFRPIYLHSSVGGINALCTKNCVVKTKKIIGPDVKSTHTKNQQPKK